MFKDFDIFYDSTNNCFQIRTKYNCYTLDFDDDDKRAIFETLIAQEDSNLANSFYALVKKFSKESVIDVFAALRDYGLLPYAGLSEVPELMPEACSTTNQELKNLNDQRVIVLSDGPLGKHLSELLAQRGINQSKLLSASLFATFSPAQIDELMEQADFFFADASAWNPAALNHLNKYALSHKKPWLYIGGIEEYQLKIGPLFLGDETGCYDCLISRIKSNHGFEPYLTSYEQYLESNRKSGRPDQFIHVESYNSIIAEYAFLEFTKFIQFWSVPATWRKVIAVNMLNFETQQHDLLKVPFCETCNHSHFYNPSPWLEPISMNGI